MTQTQYETLVKKQIELTGLVAKIADENRQPTEDEAKQIKTIKTEVDTIKSEFETRGRQAFLANLDGAENAQEITFLKKGESLESLVSKSYPDEWKRLSLQKILRGYITGEWAGAELERKSLAETPASAGGVFIPSPVASRVIDLARNYARVFQAGAVTIPMETATLRVPRLTGDVQPAWTAENATISEADATFDSVTFTARKLAGTVAISNELLEDAPTANSAVENSIAKAVALALDSAGLYGTGVAPNPLGLFVNANIPTAAAEATLANYDDVVDAAAQIRGANFEPNALLYNSATEATYAKLKDTLGQPMNKPSSIANLSYLSTNQIPVTGASPKLSSFIAGQWDQLAFGLRAGLRVEVSREASYSSGGNLVSAFANDTTVIRFVLRGDWQPFHNNAFAIRTGITVG